MSACSHQASCPTHVQFILIPCDSLSPTPHTPTRTKVMPIRLPSTSILAWLGHRVSHHTPAWSYVHTLTLLQAPEWLRRAAGSHKSKLTSVSLLVSISGRALQEYQTASEISSLLSRGGPLRSRWHLIHTPVIIINPMMKHISLQKVIGVIRVPSPPLRIKCAPAETGQ